ncbi:hypothetical protein ACWD7Y_26950 [Streptomyces drozdowiczii]
MNQQIAVPQRPFADSAFPCVAPGSPDRSPWLTWTSGCWGVASGPVPHKTVSAELDLVP